MTSADRRIAALATGQLGTFTRAQANHAGLSDRQLRSRVESGFLVRLGPNAFRVAGSPISPRTQLRGLVADVGDPVWVSGPTAAAPFGFDGFSLRPPFHLSTLDDRNVRRQGAVIHRVTSLDLIDRTTIDGLAVTSGVRTVIDLARNQPIEIVEAALERLFLLGQGNEGLLMRRIAALRSQGRYGVPKLVDAVDRRVLMGGTESWLEREYLAVLARQHLPRPLTQQVVGRNGERLIRVDCRFPDSPVVVELLGYSYHRSRSQMNSDTRRLNALLAQGLVPYQFTFDQIACDETLVADTTRLALSLAHRSA